VAAICLLAGPVYIAATADFSQPGIDTGMPTGPRLGDDLPDDAPEAAPKIYKKALRTYYDYAAPAAAGYVPPVPAFTLGDVPLEVRVLQQRAVGALRQFEITWANRYQFARFMDRLERSSPEFRAIDRDIGQVMGEKALLLICWYVHPQRDQVTLRRHWFRAYPAHVARNDLNRRARTIRHPLLEVSAPRASCPSQA
jgi:hypothetical protein